VALDGPKGYRNERETTNETTVSDEVRMKVVSLLSGGLDSTTLLAKLVDEKHEVYPVNIDYGQRHVIERAAAIRIAERMTEAPLLLVNLDEALKPILFRSNSALVNPDIPVPDGHYTDESMAITVVPNRNMMLLSIATAYAVSIGAQEVAYAPHAGDHARYPDCRPSFVHAMESAIGLCDESPIRLYTPFLNLTKTDIVRYGTLIGAPLELTYSCYKGGANHCGRCGTCVERSLAFIEAGVKDPTFYEDPEFARTVKAPA
jgi:7-cyano-7-deazaguanine synthase